MGRSKSKMTWHLEILGPRQRRVLQQIGPTLSHRGFFLVDGTAVALQLGHRRSRKKYDIEDAAHLTRSLNYFDDADRERVPKMLWDTNWRTVKKTIQSWLRDTNALD